MAYLAVNKDGKEKIFKHRPFIAEIRKELLSKWPNENRYKHWPKLDAVAHLQKIDAGYLCSCGGGDIWYWNEDVVNTLSEDIILNIWEKCINHY